MCEEYSNMFVLDYKKEFTIGSFPVHNRISCVRYAECYDAIAGKTRVISHAGERVFAKNARVVLAALLLSATLVLDGCTNGNSNSTSGVSSSDSGMSMDAWTAPDILSRGKTGWMFITSTISAHNYKAEKARDLDIDDGFVWVFDKARLEGACSDTL